MSLELVKAYADSVGPATGPANQCELIESSAGGGCVMVFGSLRYELRYLSGKTAKDLFKAAAVDFEANNLESSLSDFYKDQARPVLADSVELDSIDVTGLDVLERKALKAHLAYRNNCRVSEVFSKRNGRYYIAKGIRVIDLSNETVKALPFYDDLVSLIDSKELTYA